MATGLHSITSMALRAAAAALLWLLALGASAQTVRYIHTDALGSVAVVTDQNRNVVERREYEPYGRQLTPAIKDGPGYTGHVQDAATGLTYMQQRYYDPSIGRTLSVDPVTAYDSGDWRQFNRYAYANNNPYRFTDPDGRQAAERAYGGAVGYMLRNDPEKLRIWAGGEAAASTEGSGAEQGAAMGQTAGEFVDKGDYSTAAVGAAAVKAAVLGITYKAGGKFTRAQKRDILQANRDRNSGELRSDKSGELLQPAQQSKKGVTPPQNEAHVDHKTPRAAGGTNDPQNAQVLSRKENLEKSDRIE